ncbi:MAG: phosphoribosyl-AMP cyclohydrolase [Promethearchaeota archaeon]
MVLKIPTEEIEKIIEKVNFSKLNGLIPCITQDANTSQVLMVGFQNEEALKRTLETGIVHYYSRTRQELWQKGKTSGHIQEVLELWLDCDFDTVLVKVKQHGRACHVSGQYSCFFTRVLPGKLEQLEPDPKLM